LQLNQDVEINPLVIGFDPPHHVIGALAQIIADVAAGDFFQCALVQAVQPSIRDKTQHQITHHFRRREKQLIGSVVILRHRRMVAVQRINIAPP